MTEEAQETPGSTAATEQKKLPTEKLEAEIFSVGKSFYLLLWPVVISLQNLFSVCEEVAL
jgi:hypothetical protein